MVNTPKFQPNAWLDRCLIDFEQEHLNYLCGMCG